MRLLVVLVALWVGECAAETLRIYNWKDYIDPEVLTRFQQETGISVDYRTYTTAQELDEALRGASNFDLVVPSHFQLRRLISEGRLQPIDASRLTRRTNLDPKILASISGFEGAGRYMVPYLWSTVGIAVDRKAVERALGSSMPRSWGMLFQQNQAERLAACGMGWLDAPEEVFSLWMNLRGKRLREASARAIGDAGLQISLRAASISALNNEAYIEDLVRGKLCLAMAWSGHALAAASRRPGLEYVIPSEGALMTIDGWAIPTSSRHPQLAYRFIDYMLDPANASSNTRATFFYSPLRSDLPEMVQLAAQHPQLVPNQDERRRLYFLEELDHERKRAIDREWSVLKKGFSGAAP